MQIRVTKQFRFPIKLVTENGDETNVTGVFREVSAKEVETIASSAKGSKLDQRELLRANLIKVEDADFVDAEGAAMSPAAVKELFLDYTRYQHAACLAFMEGVAGFRGKSSGKSPEPAPESDRADAPT